MTADRPHTLYASTALPRTKGESTGEKTLSRMAVDATSGGKPYPRTPLEDHHLTRRHGRRPSSHTAVTRKLCDLEVTPA